MKHRKKEFHFWISKYTFQKIHTKIFRKKADHQTCPKIISEHPESSKNSILYGQALPIKRICSTKKDFGHHSRELHVYWAQELCVATKC